VIGGANGRVTHINNYHYQRPQVAEGQTKETKLWIGHTLFTLGEWFGSGIFGCIFSARQHNSECAVLYAIARPCLTVTHGLSVTRVDRSKRLKLGLCNFHHTVAPSL